MMFAAKGDLFQNTLHDNGYDDLSTINSKYYDIKELNYLKPDSQSSFGMFHVNMASLNKHIDDLRLIISLLEYKFDIIDISEHKIKKGDVPTANIDIPGYQPFLCEPMALNSSANLSFPERKKLIVGCRYGHQKYLSLILIANILILSTNKQ